MSGPLTHELRLYNHLKERLKLEFDLEEGDEALVDTLDGMTDLKERLVYLARCVRDTDADIAALKGIISEMKARQERFEVRREKLRGVISWCMSEAGIKSIPAPDLTLSTRQGQPPTIIDPIDPETGPARFVRVVTTFSWDKVAIRSALEAGESLDFARLGNASTVLTLRTK
jgi:hypothetical protein